MKDYVKLAVVTANKDLTDKEMLLNGAIGLAGEVGEIADIVKKHAFQGHELDKKHLFEELGDVFWYMALLCNKLDFTFEEIQEFNINKLKARYGEKFSVEASVKRGD